MSTRLSFFEIPRFKAATLEQIAFGISQEQFNTSSASGFLVDHQSTTNLEGRYVQRLQNTEKQVDPFGNEFKQELLYYVEQRFSISSSWPNLVIFNSTPALRTLTSRLSEFSIFSIAINDLKWNPEDVFKAVVLQAPDAHVSQAKIENIRVTPGIQARMVFVGSDQDIRSNVRSYLKEAEFSFSSLKIEFSYAGRNRISEIRGNGVIQNYGDYDPAVTAFWLKVIRELRKID